MIDAGGLPDAFEPPPTEPELSIDPALQDFGDVVVGDTSDPATFTITNVGDGESAQITATLGGAGAGAFTFVSNGCAGMTLAPGADCDIVIEFAPEAEARAMATLDVTDGDVRTSATLQGRGVPDAGLSISPSPHNFGRATVGTPTAPQTFTVENTGAAPSGTLTASLTGTDPGQFMIMTDGCAGMMLAPGATCTVSVVYGPATDGAHSASLTVTASPGGDVSAALSGTASSAPGLRISPLTASFGSAPTGTASSPQSFMVTNTGGLPTGVLTNTLGGANAAEFSITSSTCAGLTLAGGANCTINVVWTAGTAGDKAATLDVGDGTLTASSTLSATAVVPGTIEVEPMTRNFGTSAIGVATGATTFTARNPGGTPTGALTVAIAGTNPGDFRIVSDGCSASTLAAGGSCTVAVEFLPTAAGSRSASLRVTGSPGGTGMSALSGTGEAPAAFDLTTTTGGMTAANFGSVAIGAASANISFTLRNTGTSLTGAPAVAITGVAAVHYTIVSNTCTAPLAGAPASCTILVSFNPSATGTHTAVLEVTGSPGGRDTVDISGIGITPASLAFVSGSGTQNFLDTAETDTSGTQTITVRNDGQETTGALSTALVGSDFIIMTDNCATRTLASLASCTIIVQFRPASATPSGKTGTVTITAAPGASGGSMGSIVAALAGRALPDIELIPVGSPAAIPSIPDTAIGATSAFVEYTFRNNTSRAITFGTVIPGPSFMLGGADMGQFSLLTTGTCDSGTPVASLGQCTVRFTFSPMGVAGSTRTATLTLTGMAGTVTNTEVVTLNANATGPLIITNISAPAATAPTQAAACTGTTAISTNIDFTATQAVGSVREVRVCYQASTALAGAIRTASSFDTDLRIVADSCTGANLAAAARCSLVVRYFPQAVSTIATATNTVTMTYGAPATPSTIARSVSGGAVSGGALTVVGTGGNDFGTAAATVAVGPRTFTITNTGSLPVTALNITDVAPTAAGITDGGGRFVLVNTGAGSCSALTVPGELASSASCTVTLTYTGTVADDAALTYGRILRVSATGAATVDTSVTGRTRSYLNITTPVSKTLAFGTVNLSAPTAAQSYTITYSGVGTSPPISCNGASGFFSDYAITNNCPVGGLASGGTCTCDLVLTATNTGSRAATFLISAGGNALQQDTGSTTATANSPPNLTVSPSGTVSFGSVRLGANSSDIAFTVTNLGSIPSPAPVTTVISGASAGQFQIRPGSTCGIALAPGASCSFSARFSPTGVATGTMTAALDVDDGAAVNPTGSPAFNLTLRGEAVAASGNVLTIVPSAFVFPSTLFPGTGTADQTFTIFNNSTTDTATGVTIATNAAFPLTFPAGAGNCVNTVTNLAPGTSCTFRARFLPPSAAPHSVTMSGTSGSSGGAFTGAQSNISGSGLSAPALETFESANPSTTVAALAFNGVATGTTSDLVFIVRNVAAAPAATTSVPSTPFVTFTGGGAARYSVASTTCSTTVGLSGTDGTDGSGSDECRITIRYAPTAVGSNVATATVNFGSLTDSVTLSGNGVLNAVLGMNVTTAQTCPSTNAALTTANCTAGAGWTDYIINNGGDVAMTSPLTITFSGAQFRQNPTSPAAAATTGTAGGGQRCVSGSTTLGAGLGCTIRVQHQPNDLSADTTTITVSGNIPGGTVSTVVSPTITGNASSALTLNSGSGAFPNTAVGSASALTTFEFQYNTGASAPSGALRYSFSATGTPADFDVVRDTCTGRSLPGSAGSAAANRCQIDVVFRPSMAVARTAEFTLDDPRDFVRHQISFSGMGTP